MEFHSDLQHKITVTELDNRWYITKESVTNVVQIPDRFGSEVTKYQEKWIQFYIDTINYESINYPRWTMQSHEATSYNTETEAVLIALTLPI